MPSLRRNSFTRWMAIRLPLWVGLSLAGGAWGQPIVLHLRNGDRLSGNLVKEEAGQIILSNAVVGRIVVPLSQVDRREQSTNEIAASNATSTGAAELPPAVQRRLNELQAVYMANQLSTSEYHRQRALALAEATAQLATNRPVATASKPTGVPAPALVNP